MTRTILPALLLLCAGLALTPGAAADIDVQPLFKSGKDGLGNPLTYPDGAPAELTGVVVTMMPGDSTGWHTHPVPTFGYLLSGELTVDYATGEQKVFRAGDGIIEAQHTPHNGTNKGGEVVKILAFYAGDPGAAVTEPADPPRPDDFVALRGLIPDLRVELRYFGNNNFTGRPVTGYEAEVVYLFRFPRALSRKLMP